ncbi:MAG: hypothetical protein A3J55_02165 [Candidatus Ryanbacteria bacterium RIFCSPHIGHO2_02_FULL_45_17b]|uniref:Uncharacterized protein n=1 Tax=Candidatus Ryanbacteria bacterium RIFCSPHIGHO2_01_FULL_45_22 TaxID=1802114 RepID=A0A1G2FZB9_9BACT|nr:MAG: hypothetical protein A2719_00610 [Candidatus Ryanbacteria bacterium RIFCSPHIGHO2_01_FULL_45_22]OGZ46744.1 MAG: hypothetical protein A3J55_02165 [Candidatus Ryanbacteria bacterium RIFCSPHIGHO2_02_FULL_45_17b]
MSMGVKNMLGRGICTLIGVGLLVLAWTYASGLVVAMLDWNLIAIKFFCSFLPESYNTMVESALRMGLGADKALLFAEASAVVKTIIAIPRGLLRP